MGNGALLLLETTKAMIEPKDLRIGNLITVMRSLPYQVTGYHLYMMETYTPKDPNEADYKQMSEPIPLTEDWLKRLGFSDKPWGKLHFKMFPDGYGVKDCWLSIDASTDNSCVFFGQSYQSGMALKEIVEVYNSTPEHDRDKMDLKSFPKEEEQVHFRDIKYVHQLQNLYYSLTGEELTVNKTV